MCLDRIASSNPGAAVPSALHVIQSAGLGGSESVFAVLSRHFRAAGSRVVCAVGEEGWLTHELRKAEVAVHVLPGLGKGKVPEAGSLLALCRLIVRHDISLVHSFSFPAHAYGVLAARLTRRACLVNVRNRHHDLAGRRRAFLWRHLIAPLADAMVAVSEDLASEVERVSGRKAVCIRNGVDINPLRGTKSRAQTRAELGLPSQALVLGTIGNMRPVKGQIDLLRAAAVAAKHTPAVRVLLIGAPEEPTATELRAFCRQAGLDGNVSFLGRRDDAVELLPAMDIFCLPSLAEGTSNALLQAMAAGLPVIATAVGGNTEVVLHPRTGLLVAPRDPASMAEAMLSLARDPELRSKMGQAGRDRVAERFSLTAMIKRYEQLYQGLAYRRGIGPRRDGEEVEASRCRAPRWG